MTLSVAFSYLFGAVMAVAVANLGSYSAYAVLRGDFMDRLLLPALWTLLILTAMSFFTWAQ